jgi:hypothetical protein
MADTNDTTDTTDTTVCYLSIGALGTGFLEASLRRGLEGQVDFIGADAGSTDGGPNALAGGRWTSRERAYRYELGLLLPVVKERGVPLLVGSCGISGSDENVDYMAELVDEIATDRGLSLKVAKIYSELDSEVVVKYLEAGQVRPLDPAPAYDAEIARRSIRIVGVLGAELFQSAVDAGADVVLAGRSTDTAIFSAIPLIRGRASTCCAWRCRTTASRWSRCATKCGARRSASARCNCTRCQTRSRCWSRA